MPGVVRREIEASHVAPTALESVNRRNRQPIFDSRRAPISEILPLGPFLANRARIPWSIRRVETKQPRLVVRYGRSRFSATAHPVSPTRLFPVLQRAWEPVGVESPDVNDCDVWFEPRTAYVVYVMRREARGQVWQTSFGPSASL